MVGTITQRQRYRGALLGLTVGDALGGPYEFKKRHTFKCSSTMLGDGYHHLQPGEWTDDTSMALCLAESLVTCRGFNASDQMERYVRWYREGHMCTRDKCFDIGYTTRDALKLYIKTDEPYAGATDPNTAGNGSIMRLAPVALFYADDPRQAVRYAADSSRTTHGAIEAVDACRYLCALIIGALQGVSKDMLLASNFVPAPELWSTEPSFTPKIAEIQAGSFRQETDANIRGSGYVVKSLEAALWAFWSTETFQEGAQAAVNLGEDTDTTAAVYGQLAGAYYGLDAIPAEWRQQVFWSEKIIELADQLHEGRSV